MIFLFLTAIVFLLTAILVISAVLFLRSKKTEKLLINETLRDILDEKMFQLKKIAAIDNHFFLAINKKLNKLAVIKNFNIKTLNYEYEEIMTLFITDIIQTGSGFKIDYIKQGEKKTLFINSHNKELKDFLYKIHKAANIKKIEEKYVEHNFTITSGSDFENTYVWAYCPINCFFAYFRTKNQPSIQKINLRKKHFTIDLNYNYFEAPIFGEYQQLLYYENNFLRDLFSSLFQTIKQKTSMISEDLIYYDDYNNILYLSNGLNSLQSLVLSEIEEVHYLDNKLSFTLFDETKVINFPADNNFIKEFEDFVTGYNLRKIASNFNYKIDKLINTTTNTKLIIDSSRDRIVYCANLNTISRFSYLTISFINLNDVKIEKSQDGYFVRIYTKDGEIIDVTCKKHEVAQYILAQIKSIINS